MAKYGSSNSGPWQPGVLYLLVLIVAEIAVMGALRSFTKHGG